MRQHWLSSLGVSAVFLLSLFTLPLQANAACCKCRAESTTTDICLTTTAAKCDDLLASSNNLKLAGFTCAPDGLSDADCKNSKQGGKCENGVFSSTSYGTSPDQTATNPNTIPAPALNVDIPGVSFSNLLQRTAAGKAVVPFLAQYIAAVSKYIMGVSVIVAAIMFTYGGFLYIIGSSGKSVAEAKQIITDAAIGLILVFATYQILALVNTSFVTPKPLEVQVIKKDELADFLEKNGTTYLGAPIPSEQTLVNSSQIDGLATPLPPPQPGVPVDRVDVSNISYSSSDSATENIGKYCTSPRQAAQVKTYEEKQKLLAKAILGYFTVCIKNNRCVYSQASVTGVPSGKMGPAAPLPTFAVRALKKVGLTPEAIYSNSPTCLAEWEAKPSLIDGKQECIDIAKQLYIEKINNKIEEARAFASDCVSFVMSIYSCTGAKGKFWGQPLVSAIKSIALKKEPDPAFLALPQMVYFGRIGDGNIEAKVAEKGGVKFGDIFYVSGGTGQNAMHYYLYTGGRSDIPFTFIEMGGAGPGMVIPGVGQIGGASIKTKTWQEDLKAKMTSEMVYPWYCPQSGCTTRGRGSQCKATCTEKDMVLKKASYNSDGVLMIWRPFAE